MIELRYVFDARNRLTVEWYNVSGTSYSLGYGYDRASNLVQVAYPGGYRLNYTYDGLGRVSGVGSFAEYHYLVDSSVDWIGYGNGVVTDFSYDSLSRPTRILTYDGGATLLNCTYTYDRSGSVTQIRNSSSVETYGYDMLDRLTGTTGPWGNITYTYDSVGNMLSRGATGYTYNEMNQLTRVGAGDDYTYDPNGNLIVRESGADTWAYVWDSDNRLVSAARNGTLQRRYSYDAGGRRVMSYGGASGNMLYAYIGLSIVYEAPVGGGDSTLRFYSGMLQVAEKTGATVTYLHQDHLGSTRLVTNSTGGVVFRDNYQPFGVDSGMSGSEEFRYTGKPSDDSTGLYYYGARYYDPSIGRFITEDTLLGRLSDPQSLNRYLYCQNNPMKYVDRNGRGLEYAYGMGGAALLTLSGPWGWFLLGVIIVVPLAIEYGPTLYGMLAPQTTPPTPDTGIITSTPEEQLSQVPSPILGNINQDKQGKHQPNEPNYEPGKSVLTEDPEQLYNEGAGKGQSVDGKKSGDPGFKERVNFGKIIGFWVEKDTYQYYETTNGVIHYAKSGAHIVPSRPSVR